MTTVGWLALAAIGTGAIVWGAEIFAEHLSVAATRLGVSAFALAILLAGAEPEELATAVTASLREAPNGAEGDGRRSHSLGAELNVFRREGDHWSVTFEGRTVRVRDIKGMRYLAQLLAEPGREFHVVDLVAIARGETARADSRAEPGLASAALGDAGEMLDRQAKDAYRRRLGEIEEDIDEAKAMGDAERAAQADAERDFLIRELSRAVGLGGRDRQAGSASERARASVTRAVRQAMSRIREHHPSLGEHLDRAIQTGTYCTYLSDPRAPVSWTF